MGAFANLSRGVKIFLAVDAVLVLALVVAAVVVLGGGPERGDDTAEPPPAATTSSADAAGDDPSPGEDPSPEPQPSSDDAQSLASPTGNIACTLSVDGVTCTIANKQFEVPAAEGCTGSTGHVIVLNEAAGVTTPCVEGPTPAVASAETPVLEYGRAQSVGPYTCTSNTDGMACVVTASGEGFRVATAALTPLP
jgi:hypothetical protein